MQNENVAKKIRAPTEGDASRLETASSVVVQQNGRAALARNVSNFFQPYYVVYQ